MARQRIGEALLERGLITPPQLQQALRDQKIHGGHLGTCLIELGFVREEDLGRTLGELQNMRYATWNELAGADAEALACVPKEMVERYSVVPIRLEDRSLHVATVAAGTLSALSRETHKRIVPWVAPEIRIFEAMELHYGIPLHPRYIKLKEQLDQQRLGEGVADESAAPAEQPQDTAAEEQWISAPEEQGPDPGAAFGYGRSWREIAAEEFADTEADQPARSEAAAQQPATAAQQPRPAAPQPAAGPTNTDTGSMRLDPVRLARVAALLRVRQAIDDDLARDGYPSNRRAAGDRLALWIAWSALGLTLDPDTPGLAKDELGHVYRIVRTRNCPDDGCVLEAPVAPRVDRFLCIRMDELFHVTGILRASFDTVCAAATMRAGDAQVDWDVLEDQGAGVEVLYGAGSARQAKTPA